MVVTRFVCVSDTHGFSTKDGVFKLPKGDVLIHAGDLTNQGTISELRKTLDWILHADFEVKIVVAGNHDVTLDKAFYSQNYARFHNQKSEISDECISLFAHNPEIVYLNHEPREIRLNKPDGPRTIFRVFGSPYSPAEIGDKWAFRYLNRSEEAEKLWGQIPLDTDVVVTHTPPRNHCDSCPAGSIGCEALRRALWRVRPRLAVCGHVHHARGYDRVWWDKTDVSRNGEVFSEAGSLPPLGSKKQCLVDLTGRKQRRLANDGSRDSNSTTAPLLDCTTALSNPDTTGAGRNETCIINASILANSWPYTGGRKFFSPIIVDLDLPQDTFSDHNERRG
ncbi:hypothetical protein VTO42DRAFT_8 [Malbranchea cinnamomea]